MPSNSEAAWQTAPLNIDLRTAFQTIEDSRVQRTQRHNLTDILVIATCAMLCGQGHYTHMEAFGKLRRSWLETFLPLPNGIPSHDTFRNVFSLLDPKHFAAAFHLWTQGVLSKLNAEEPGSSRLQGVIAIDGKALRRAVDSGDKPAVIVGAWASELNLCLGQVKVADKSNEISALPTLLEMLALKGCIVTLDAMGCQREVAQKVVERGGDYILALKGNQESLHQQVSHYLDTGLELAKAEGNYHEEESCGHGRKEVRRCWVTDDVGGWLQGADKWTGLRTVAAVECERTLITTGETTVQRRYFISSLQADAALIASSVREHWGIENSLHWVLDVTFREDESRARTGASAENLDTLRRLAHGMIKNENPASKKSINQRKFEAGLNPDYLLSLLGIKLDA
jgi:predicted transposase YbfD/YdcC